jgi:hypothetical protein
MKYKNNKYVLAAIFALALLSSSYVTDENNSRQSPGKSDRKAIQIAKEVMKAMGGQQSWDNTHYVSWNFFGSRKLLWDKWGGIVRIDWLKKSRNIIVNLNDGTGKVQLDGVQQTHPDSLAKYLKMGREVWINDSYWVFMPFKLLDPGVTLKYLGRNKTEDGSDADLLQLTFNIVGVTPENKYKVWVDKSSRLVTQWAYFQNFTDEQPKFTNRWSDYKRYGKIMLSGDRGRDGSTLYPIEVLEQVAPESFVNF